MRLNMLKTKTISSLTLAGLLDQVNALERDGWELTDARTEHVVEMMKRRRAKIVFEIGPVSERVIKRSEEEKWH